MQAYEYYDGYGFERNPQKVQYIVLGDFDNRKIICYIISGSCFICEIGNIPHEKAWEYKIIDIPKCIKYIKKGLIILKRFSLRDEDENNLIIFNFANTFLDELIETYSFKLLQNKSIIKIQKQYRQSISDPNYMLCKKRLIKEFSALC